MPSVNESRDDAIWIAAYVHTENQGVLLMGFFGVGIFFFVSFLWTGYPFPSNFLWYLVVNHGYFLTKIGSSEVSHLDVKGAVWFWSHTAQWMI